MINKLFTAVLILQGFIACTDKKIADDPKAFRVHLNPVAAESKDPLLNLDQERLKVLSLVYESLLRYSPTGTELQAQLLSELPTLSADQLTFNFKLKSGIKFHSSSKLQATRTVNSKDVVMSLLRGVLDENTSNYGNLLLGLVQGLSEWAKSSAASGEWYGRSLPSGFQVKNDLEFSIRLMRKYPDFLAILTLPAFSILPTEVLGGTKITEAIGTGPFHFDDVQVDSKNWNMQASNSNLKFTKIQVDASLDHKDIQKSDYAVLPLKLAVDLVDPSTGSLKNMPGFSLRELRLRRVEMLVFNLNDPVVKTLGVDFRRAVLSVLNREQILKSMYKGFASNVLQFIPPGVEGALAESSVKVMSVEEATKKIKKALGKKLLKIQFPESAAYWMVDLQKDLEKIGPHFEFEPVEASTYLERIEKGAFQVGPLSWEGDLPEATNFLQLYYGATNAQNLSGYKSQAFDLTFDKLSKLFPSPQRKVLAEEAHQRVLADLPSIPLGFKKEYVVLAARASALNSQSLGASSLKDFLLAP